MPETNGPAVAPGPSILLTGATGNLGREVVDRLLARGVRVRCLVRERVAPRPGIEWVLGDLTDPGTVGAALAGIETVLLIWPLLDSGPARAVIAELATAAPRVLYLSSTAIDDRAERQSDPIVQVHADLEALLHEAGLQPVVLRSDTLASNARGWVPQVLAGDLVSGPYAAPTAIVDERDVADAAVTVLLAPHNGPDAGPYLLTGPEVLSRTDQIVRLGTVLGRDLRFQALSPEAAAPRMLAAGLPKALVGALVAAAAHRPVSNLVSDDLERLLGRPAGTFDRWAIDHAGEFSGRR